MSNLAGIRLGGTSFSTKCVSGPPEAGASFRAAREPRNLCAAEFLLSGVAADTFPPHRCSLLGRERALERP